MACHCQTRLFPRLVKHAAMSHSRPRHTSQAVLCQPRLQQLQEREPPGTLCPDTEHASSRSQCLVSSASNVLLLSIAEW